MNKFKQEALRRLAMLGFSDKVQREYTEGIVHMSCCSGSYAEIPGFAAKQIKSLEDKGYTVYHVIREFFGGRAIYTYLVVSPEDTELSAEEQQRSWEDEVVAMDVHNVYIVFVSADIIYQPTRTELGDAYISVRDDIASRVSFDAITRHFS